MNTMLKQAIVEKYGTEAAFARHINWSKQRVNKMTHGKTEPRVADLNLFSKELGLSISEVISFFDQEVTNM